MKTTDSIVEGLQRARAEHLEAGRFAEVGRVDQEIIAHQTLAKLRADRDAARENGDDAARLGIEQQIAFWLRMVDDDVDEPAVEPHTDTPGAVLAPVAVKPKRG